LRDTAACFAVVTARENHSAATHLGELSGVKTHCAATCLLAPKKIRRGKKIS
jgi:hypothetical protein